MPGRWSKQSPDPLHPNWQTWENDPCTASVLMGTSNPAALAAHELVHARQQEAIQQQYPGRGPLDHPTNVVPLTRP
jgi:hypothetical protein